MKELNDLEKIRDLIDDFHEKGNEKQRQKRSKLISNVKKISPK